MKIPEEDMVILYAISIICTTILLAVILDNILKGLLK